MQTETHDRQTVDLVRESILVNILTAFPVINSCYPGDTGDDGLIAQWNITNYI